MIILLGPDNTGKSTLLSRLITHGVAAYKADRDTSYERYLEVLLGQRKDKRDPTSFEPGPFLDEASHWVCDRFFYCDLPYSEVLRQSQSSYTLKELHNMHLVTVSHNPVVVLTTHQGPGYDEDTQFAGKQRVPKSIQAEILAKYKEYLEILGVKFIEWDYRTPPMTMKKLIEKSIKAEHQVAWWRELARSGVAGVGSTTFPTRAMIVAQDIGPSNYHNIPFERGPSGRWLSELLDEAEIPLSEIYLTNFDKWGPGHGKLNADAMAMEIERVQPRHYILFGARARDGAGKILAKMKVPKERIHVMIHPGAIVNHSESISEMEKRKKKFLTDWCALWDVILGRKATVRAKGPDGVFKIR